MKKKNYHRFFFVLLFYVHPFVLSTEHYETTLSVMHRCIFFSKKSRKEKRKHSNEHTSIHCYD